MWRSCKVVGIIVPLILLGLVVFCFLHLRQITFLSKMFSYLHRAQQRRVMLLCNTDHQALLEAGREILSKIPKDRLNPQPDGITLMGHFSVPEGIQIPQAIMDLRSGCVVNYDGYLRMEMHGGMDHFGVLIYPADLRKPYDSFEYGDKELLPGLWYYDEGYHYNPEKYDKRIDELVKKHKK